MSESTSKADSESVAPKGVKSKPSKPAKKSAKNPKSRKRGVKQYPVLPFDQAIRFGQDVAEVGAGHPVNRKTLFEAKKLSVNPATKSLISASSGRYAITKGAHDAEQFSLTDIGALATADADTSDRRKARFELAIAKVPLFNELYEKFCGGKLPATSVIADSLISLDDGDRMPCVEVFLSNAKFVGLLQVREGSEYLAKIEDAKPVQVIPATATINAINQPPASTSTIGEDFETVCFFIAPIGKDDSEQRKHSDAILASYVEKALANIDPNLRVVRADKITQPGLISKQVLEYLLRSRLVVADLSYHNPNVFYELAVRHATGKPVIHIKRASDPIPFDNKDFRTIDIPFEDKFEILAQIESVRTAIAQSSRQALANGDSIDNPLLVYFPDHRFLKREPKDD